MLGGAAMGRLMGGLLLPLALACGSEDGGDGGPSNDAGASDSGEDASVPGCPRPGDPWVHYISQDPSQCVPEEIVCTPDLQYGFDNSCGCGCLDKGDPTCVPEDDPDVRFFSHDPAHCTGIPACLPGETGFSNSCGCGCIQH